METGNPPKSVERTSTGKWKVKGVSEDHRAAIMQLNRQRLEGGARLSVKQVEDRLKVRDIDQLMRRWLKVDERVSSSVRERDHGHHRQEYRRPHFVREVEADAENPTTGEEDTTQQVARVEVPRQQAKPAETHPNKGKGEKKAEEPKKTENTNPPPTKESTPQAPPAPQQGEPPRGPPTQWHGRGPSPPYQVQWTSPEWGWHTPTPIYWDPSWVPINVPWHHGKTGTWQQPGKGSTTKGKGMAMEWPGKGSTEKGKGAHKGGKGQGKSKGDGKGKGGRGMATLPQ